MNSINDSFRIAYFRLEEALRRKFSLSLGGVECYIRHVSRFGGGDSGNDIAKRLRKYSAVSEKPREEISFIGKPDVAWLNTFRKMVTAGKDPLSRYLNCD